jgi:hypothetical protein
MATKDFPEHKDSILLLTLGPLIWAAHLLLSYGTASIWCGKIVGIGGSLGAVRGAIIVYTLAGLAATSVIAWMGYRRHRTGAASLPHDDDSPEDRSRFIGYATFLLACLSFAAIAFAGSVALFFWRCY